jgi:hypothetical protein
METLQDLLCKRGAIVQHPSYIDVSSRLLGLFTRSGFPLILLARYENIVSAIPDFIIGIAVGCIVSHFSLPSQVAHI